MSTLFVSKKNTESSSKMILKSQKLLAGALAFVLVAGGVAPAFALTIDNFNDGVVNLTANSGSPSVQEVNAGLNPNDTLGGVRTTDVFYDAGGLSLMANANPPTDRMAFSSDSGTTGMFMLTYDDDGNGLGGIDLTANGGDRFVVGVPLADLPSSIHMTVTDTTGPTTGERTIPLPAGVDQTYEIPFADFSNSVDFSSVDKITIEVEGVANGDYEVDLIGVPQRQVGGTVGSMDSVTLLVAGAQANMGLWSLALVGAIVSGGAIIYKTKSKKSEQ